MNAVNNYGQGSKSWEEVARNAMADRADLLRENAELKKYSEGLDMNLAAVIQRAEAAEKALADAQSRLAHTQAGLSIWMERSKANAAEYNEAYDAMCDIAQMLDCAEDWATIKGRIKKGLV